MERPTTPAARPPLARPGPKVENVALGASRARLDQAISDLRRVGLWDDLTRHLYRVKLASRLGRVNVPEDGHLADAVLTAVIDDDGQGALCDVMFFPTALRDDLARWRAYFSQGLLDEPPPPARHFWAAIVAHELAHCLGHGRGEEVAERWEARALTVLRRRQD